MKALWVGLMVHQPSTTEQEARKVYLQLQRESRKNSSEQKVVRIFACLFGLPDPLESDGLPKS